MKAETERLVKDTETSETRYYISDEEGLDAKYHNSLARGHWGIENNLHWHLDVNLKKMVVGQGLKTPLKTYLL